MVLIEVTHGSAVAHHKVLEPPLVTKNLLKQTGVATAGVVVQTLVGAHHLPHLRILHQTLEGGHIGLPQVADAHVGQVGCVARVFRAAVYGIVLGAGPQLAVFAALRALQTTNHGTPHHRRQVGVLTIGLLTTTPPGVTEDVHIRSPYRQAIELLSTLILTGTLVILSAELCTRGVEHTLQQLRIERRSHTDRLRKHRHIAHVRSTMERLAPPEKLLDAKPLYGRTLVQHQHGLLLKRQTGAQILGALPRTQLRVLVRQLLSCHRKESSHNKNKSK